MASASTVDVDPFVGSGDEFDSDMDLAFRLQIQEAITASLATTTASSSGLVIGDSDVDVDRGLFRVYCKGLVEGGQREKMTRVGVGVAVCDKSGGLVMGVKRGKVVDGRSSRGEAEAKAVVEGMNKAVEMGLRSVVFYCDYYALYCFITHKWKPKQQKIAKLVSQVDFLRQKFQYFRLSLVTRNDLKFAFKLAREAISDQMVSPMEYECGSSHNSKETCDICLEDTAVNEMFSIEGCHHRYCFSCMKQHVEVKLLHGVVPTCPHEGCKSELSVSSCSKFLTPKMMNTMVQRIKEASIPVAEKFYCPYPTCSALMSKKEIDSSLFERGRARKCMSCHKLFCIDCKVPWHSSMTCDEYERLHCDPPLNDAGLRSLAKSNLWRQCEKCSHMIELSEGCYHMTCRCGYEFCYNCGAEWKDKKATCNCPLWVEEYILHDFESDFEGEDDDDYEEEEYKEEDAIFYFFNPDVLYNP